MSRPWMKWYPRDWRADPRLRMCSLAARGLWIEVIGFMHEAEPYGYLLIDGKAPDLTDIAALVGRPLKEVRAAWLELGSNGVFTCDETGAHSRRMLRDNARAMEGRENIERRWANSPPIRGPNSPPNRSGHRYPIAENVAEPITQKPDTRKEDAAPPPSSAEKELFDRGKAVLGKDAGGLIAKLLKAKGGSVAQARAAIEQASEKQDPREYIGRVIAGPLPREGEFVWKSGIPGVL